MTPNYIYRGELLSKPKHNTLAYNRIPKNHIIIFDIDVGNQHYLSHPDKVAEAARIGLEVVPLLYSGTIPGMDEMMAMLEKVSVLGGQQIEGFVVKNYDQYNPMDSKTLMCKYVSEAFKEVHKTDFKKRNPNKGDVLQQIIDTYKTVARWNKAEQNMREQGTLMETPADIGNLIKEVFNDIREECELDIKERLWMWAWPGIKRGVTNGLPQWYKQRLLEQFTLKGETNGRER